MFDATTWKSNRPSPVARIAGKVHDGDRVEAAVRGHEVRLRVSERTGIGDFVVAEIDEALIGAFEDQSVSNAVARIAAKARPVVISSEYQVSAPYEHSRTSKFGASRRNGGFRPNTTDDGLGA